MKLHLTTLDDVYYLARTIENLKEHYGINTDELSIEVVSSTNMNDLLEGKTQELKYKILLNVVFDGISDRILRHLRRDKELWNVDYRVKELLTDYNISSSDIKIKPVVINGDLENIEYDMFLEIKEERSLWKILADSFKSPDSEKEEDENEEL